MSESSEAPQTQFVSVPVPADLVEAVYAFIAATRANKPASEEPGSESGAHSPAGGATDEPPWDHDSLRELARHHNEKLRALLLYLAERPGEPVPMEEAMPAAGVPTGRAAGGWFSRLNRSSLSRYGRGLPIYRDWSDGRTTYEIALDPDDLAVLTEELKKAL